MTRLAPAARLAATLAVAVAVVGGCASARSGHTATPSSGSGQVDPGEPGAPGTSQFDPRLVGTWHPLTVVRPGRPALHADDTTDASLVFRPSGLVVTNGSACGAPTVSSVGNRLTLTERNPQAYCSTFDYGSRAGLRVDSAVEHLVGTRTVDYSVSGDTLTLTAGTLTVTLARGGPPTATSSS